MRRLLVPLAALLPLQAPAQDERLESTITGNQEQPQVLYIVPWQSPDSPTLKYNVARDQSIQVYQHLERSELARELELLDPVASTSAEAPNPEATTGAPESSDESQSENDN